jgi:hypothetical protein
MRWTDTALPNPDTFTASLRRLDADGSIERIGKQERARRKSRRRQAVDVGRSGVVKAQIVEGGLAKAGLTEADVERVRRLLPAPDSYMAVPDPVLLAVSIKARRDENRHVDEGALVETAFHKFPAAFAYRERPEFPDIARIKDAISSSIRDGLITPDFELTGAGHSEVEKHSNLIGLRIDSSESHKTGAFKLADRIAGTAGFEHYRATGTLTATKADELFRVLRVAPTTDPRPVAQALIARSRDLRRIDRGDLADYLSQVAAHHNPDAQALARDELQAATAAIGGEK